MKFLTFHFQGEKQAGLLTPQGKVFRLTEAWRLCSGGTSYAPSDLAELITEGEDGLENVRWLLERHGTDDAFLTSLEQVRLLAPIPRPSKNVFCIGRNYREHIVEGNRARGRDPNDFPKVIEVFTKPPTSVIGPLAPIARHAAITTQLDYEVELGIVIGKTGVDIPKAQALDFVFGYTIVNDVTARDLQKAHGQWFKGKGLDGSCPIGPYIVHKTAVTDPHALAIQLEVNGELRQDSNTSDLLFKIEDIVAQLSQGLTLEAGDIIATGTPSGVGLGLTPPRFLQAGDVITARITGLGELTNTVSD